MDPAIQSRIHLSLPFSDFQIEQRKQVWQNLIDRNPNLANIDLNEYELEKLASVQLDETDIKGVLDYAEKGASLGMIGITYGFLYDSCIEWERINLQTSEELSSRHMASSEDGAPPSLANTPRSPLLEAYHGTYQSISPMPSPTLVASKSQAEVVESTSSISFSDEVELEEPIAWAEAIRARALKFKAKRQLDNKLDSGSEFQSGGAEVDSTNLPTSSGESLQEEVLRATVRASRSVVLKEHTTPKQEVEEYEPRQASTVVTIEREPDFSSAQAIADMAQGTRGEGKFAEVESRLPDNKMTPAVDDPPLTAERILSHLGPWNPVPRQHDPQEGENQKYVPSLEEKMGRYEQSLGPGDDTARKMISDLMQHRDPSYQPAFNSTFEAKEFPRNPSDSFPLDASLQPPPQTIQQSVESIDQSHGQELKKHDPIQEEADRTYREIMEARQVASQVLRSHHGEDEESREGFIANQLGLEIQMKQEPLDAPNADFQFDAVWDPMARLPATTARDQDVPALNLIVPSPVPSPKPKNQQHAPSKTLGESRPPPEEAVFGARNLEPPETTLYDIDKSDVQLTAEQLERLRDQQESFINSLGINPEES